MEQKYEIMLQARLAAIEYMFANLYVHFCESNGVSAPMIKAQNDELRERLANLEALPGVDPLHFDVIAQHFGAAVQSLLVQIEAKAGTAKMAS